MSYFTNYKLSVVSGEPEALKLFHGCVDFGAEFSSAYATVLEVMQGLSQVKWYGHEYDMRKLSVRFPGVLFKLSGDGEEQGDRWHKYFRNGRMQVCRAEITFPPFDENKLE